MTTTTLFGRRRRPDHAPTLTDPERRSLLEALCRRAVNGDGIAAASAFHTLHSWRPDVPVERIGALLEDVEEALEQIAAFDNRRIGVTDVIPQDQWASFEDADTVLANRLHDAISHALGGAA